MGYCTRILWWLSNVGEGLSEGSALVVVALLQKVSTAYQVKLYRTYLLLLAAFDHAGVASHLARHLLDVPYTVYLSISDILYDLIVPTFDALCQAGLATSITTRTAAELVTATVTVVALAAVPAAALVAWVLEATSLALEALVAESLTLALEALVPESLALSLEALVKALTTLAPSTEALASAEVRVSTHALVAAEALVTIEVLVATTLAREVV